MKTCPECQKQVTEEAIACKFCGYIFGSPVEPHLPRPVAKPKQSYLSCGLLILLLIIAGSFVIYNIFFNGSSDPKTTPTPDTSPIMAATMCQQFVEKDLISPKTAEFQPASQAEVSGYPYTGYTVKSYVDSQNAFAAIIRTEYTCIISYQGSDIWQLIHLTYP